MLGFLSLSAFSESNQRKTREERALKLSPLLTLYSRQHGSRLLPAPRAFLLNRFCGKVACYTVVMILRKAFVLARVVEGADPYRIIDCFAAVGILRKAFVKIG